jgi:hypothetical protein
MPQDATNVLPRPSSNVHEIGPFPETLSVHAVAAGAEMGPLPETLFAEAAGPPPVTPAAAIARATRIAESMVYETPVGRVSAGALARTL